MISAALPDLDALDMEALKALVIAQHSELLEQHVERARDRTSEADHREVSADDLRQEDHTLTARATQAFVVPSRCCLSTIQRLRLSVLALARYTTDLAP